MILQILPARLKEGIQYGERLYTWDAPVCVWETIMFFRKLGDVLFVCHLYKQIRDEIHSPSLTWNLKISKNDGVQKESPFSGCHFQVSCQTMGGYKLKKRKYVTRGLLHREFQGKHNWHVIIYSLMAQRKQINWKEHLVW